MRRTQILSLVCLFILVSSATAQRGGRGEGGRGEGGRGEGGRGGRGGDRDFQQRGFRGPSDRGGRGNFRQPLESSRTSRALSASDDETSQPTTDSPYPVVARFGEEEFPTFGLSPETLAGKIIDLEKKYDSRVLEFVSRSMERYDANKNGILEHSEWASVAWRGDPRDSDLDKDGMLTRAEMAERFANQESSRSSGRDSRGRGNEISRRGGDSGQDFGSRVGFGGRGFRGRGGPDSGFSGRGAGGSGRGGFAGPGQDNQQSGRAGGRGFRGREFGGGGDRGRGGRGGRGDRGSDNANMLVMMVQRMDANGDGTLQPNEVDERRRQMLSERLKIDFSKPISVAAITRKAGGDSKEQSNSFEVEGSQVAGARIYSQGSARKLPTKLPDWWESKDKNIDGQITMVEFLKDRSTKEINEFSDYDINGDGVVTAGEAEAVQIDILKEN